MGVRLDWEVERETVARELGESPADVRWRRANGGRALLATLLIVLLILAVAGGILARLWYVDQELKRQLRETVAAEAAALRVGDLAAFLAIQRSSSDAWMLGQAERFWQYQELKQQADVDVSGKVIDLAVDESRAWVLVEEAINGIPYRQVWFYWRYADGWRHVPRDITFWGMPATISGANFILSYGSLDSPLAEALQPGLERLWGQGCTWLDCPTPLPALTVRIMPDPFVEVSWSPDEADVLRVASPLLGRARADVPLEPDLARRIGDLLAERVLIQAGAAPVEDASRDAAFLRAALRDWLVGRFLGDGGVLGSSFVESLVAAYGERAAALLAARLTPEADIDILAHIFATPLEALPVDWREFFQWRLALEPFLLAQGLPDALRGLYDPAARGEAEALIASYAAGVAPPVPTVVRVITGFGSDGGNCAWAVVQDAEGNQAPITFRLVDGVWRRGIPDPAFAVYAGMAENTD